MKPPDDLFATTRWTLVRAAGKADGSALAELCSAYWIPVYSYVRRRSRSKEDAEDLTQGFFAQLLERGDIAGLRRENGKFRAFLLAAVKHHLANDHDRRRALKRGGGIEPFPLDWQEADSRFQLADESGLPPDACYDRSWATTLLARVLVSLAAEVADPRRFAGLRPYLTVDRDEISYAEAAAALGMEAGAVRVAVHRLRKRYRSLLREEVARTLADPAQVEEELSALMAAFG
ncbi:RNA polymerase sigma factor [Luteolibacter marinus]|uniref:RNA polymerase sigma factor n=1 Tax=Luteolibacter marinus TaxID=2776705 RepID=UPI001865CB6E|nr:sigma factor [Luteolibacter marinus]